MTIIEIVAKVISVLLELLLNRQDPAAAKLRAAAVLTREMNDDIESFDRALKDQDQNALALHFELLHRRVSQKTSGTSGNTFRPPSNTNRG